MDYIEGGTLDEYIASTSARGKIPSPTQIVHLFTSMSLAIDYAHQQGMIHRDIKPANILLDKNNTTRNPMGEPILTDFGVAKLLGVTSSTLSASQLGTPLYVSPEQVRGYPGNERSDIYALGVILYEMVTGVPPFRGDTAVNVFTQHLNVTPTSPALINPSLPTALTLVILKALAKDPNERFASAASMTAAIAEALNMPVPESLGQAAYSQDEANMPTYLHSPWQLGTAPLPPSSTSGVDVINRAALHATPSAPSGGAQVYQVAPPRDGTAKTGDPQATPLPAMHSPSPPPSQQRRRWRTLYGVVAALIIIAVLGSAVLVFFLKYTAAQVSPALASAVVGHCFFVSSGQLNPDSAQGIADQLEIDLQNIPDPQSGKGYYAWLLPDRHPKAENDPLQPTPQFALPLLLSSSPLPVNHGRISFFYKGTAQHDNLFSLASRLLITEENANGAPHNPLSPGADRGTWRYYAEIPQTPYGTTSLSALDHIRHLFYKETRVEVLGLPGGLDTWLFRNTEKIVEWSGSARDAWNSKSAAGADLIRRQLSRILAYLDGTIYYHIELPGESLRVDPTIAKVALLEFDVEKQDPPGYLYHIGTRHLHALIQLPDASPDQKELAVRISKAIDNVNVWLQTVHNDALKLFKMTNGQLFGDDGRLLLDELATQANYAFVGQINPYTSQVKEGVVQVHYNIQRLATFEIRECTSSHPCAL
jgi:hypothetical protein